MHRYQKIYRKMVTSKLVLIYQGLFSGFCIKVHLGADNIWGTEDCSCPPQALCSAMHSCLARRLECINTIVQPHACSYTKNSEQAIRQQTIADFMSL